MAWDSSDDPDIMAAVARRKKMLGLNSGSEQADIMAKLNTGAPAPAAKTTDTGSTAASLADTAGDAMTTAGTMTANPWIAGAGIALKAGAGIYNAVKGPSDEEKTAAKRADEAWQLQRAQLLQQLGEARKKDAWKATFQRTLARGGK